MSKPMKPNDPARRARAARDRAVRIAMRRKEEYIGTRVPRELKERVIEQAAREGVPVSLLVRRVLEEAFGVPMSTEAPFPRREAASMGNLSAVLAWQSVELAQAAQCVRCGRALREGEAAWLALGVEPAPSLVCDSCRQAIRPPAG